MSGYRFTKPDGVEATMPEETVLIRVGDGRAGVAYVANADGLVELTEAQANEHPKCANKARTACRQHGYVNTMGRKYVNRRHSVTTPHD